uniref:Uncharacterized protein n=1 Tax=Rhodosorus marinus TaxID=101924 RepID=A0A7S0BKV2_9RHOD|mmetsp:Transcript_20168/g.29274  ORF Transcript_20168/g.29274 Transcript_20168/m.29274 type:complete len:170 (+) Transcript_20168:100-609(+)
MRGEVQHMFDESGLAPFVVPGCQMSRIPIDSLLNEQDHEEASAEETEASPSLRSAKAAAKKSRTRWSAEEDEQLRTLVEKHGEGNWDFLASFFSTDRTGRQLRARWKNNLDPRLVRSVWASEEDARLLYGRAQGDSWSSLARSFPGRCDNDLKNRYYQLQRGPGSSKLR